MAIRARLKTFASMFRKRKSTGSFVVQVKPLLPELVQRLKKVAPVAYRNFGKMQNIDHRQNWPKAKYIPWGKRVRQMNTSRNFHSTEIAIKAVHGHTTAQYTIATIKNIVREHNEKFKPKNYVLLEPVAYALSKGLILMPKINAPQVNEILSKKEATKRGKLFFSKLEKKCGVTEKMLKKAHSKVLRRINPTVISLVLDKSKPYYIHFWLLGFKEGKFVFMPLLDLF